MEIFKWILVIILLLIAMISNYYQNILLIIRILIIIITIFISGILISLTKAGKLFRIFFQESKQEMRKVRWPGNKETLYTTLIVVTATAIMSIILWGLDTILLSIISFLTNLRL
ncbi:MAG: preprotein translocase subunit SecE [Candidatus Dasytiphilus stammeri]